MEQPKNDVLKVKRLHVEFQTSHGMVHAVKDVSLKVKRRNNFKTQIKRLCTKYKIKRQINSN